MKEATPLPPVPEAAPAAAPAPAYPEREHRYAVYLAGTIRRVNAGNRMPIKVRNISACGLMCECAYPAHIDDAVEVELPRLGFVTGHIRWGANGKIGIEFDGPIDPTVAWMRSTQSVALLELPKTSPRRPGVMAAH